MERLLIDLDAAGLMAAGALLGHVNAAVIWGRAAESLLLTRFRYDCHAGRPDRPRFAAVLTLESVTPGLHVWPAASFGPILASIPA